MNTESNHLSVIPDLNKSRCVNAVRRIARKGLRTDRVWIIDRKDRNGVITHSLVLPYAFEDEDRHEACNDGKELINCLSRIKKVAETDFSTED